MYHSPEFRELSSNSLVSLVISRLEPFHNITVASVTLDTGVVPNETGTSGLTFVFARVSAGDNSLKLLCQKVLLSTVLSRAYHDQYKKTSKLVINLTQQ